MPAWDAAPGGERGPPAALRQLGGAGRRGVASAPDGITAGWCQQWRLLSQKACPAGATVGGGGRHSIGLENMCIGWGRACMGAECPCTLALAELDRAGAPALPCHCLHAHLPACHSNRGCISKPGPAAHRSGRAPGKVWAVNLHTSQRRCSWARRRRQAPCLGLVSAAHGLAAPKAANRALCRLLRSASTLLGRAPRASSG